MAGRRVIGRGPIFLAGGIILAGVFAQAHPDFIANPPRSPREACGQLVDPALCDAAGAIDDLRPDRARGPGRGAAGTREPSPPTPIETRPAQGPVVLQASSAREREPYEVPAIPIN